MLMAAQNRTTELHERSLHLVFNTVTHVFTQYLYVAQQALSAQHYYCSLIGVAQHALAAQCLYSSLEKTVT